jgi:DNA polymerase III epsilon subunit-like protein
MPLLVGARLVAIDTETTGFDPERGHELLEVGVVEIVSGAIGATWSSLVRPMRPIPDGAAAVHGITAAMVEAAPAPGVVARELTSRAAGAALVFHHAAFDLPFLQQLLRGAGLPPLLNPVLDTFGLARLLKPQSHGLAALAAELGLPAEPAHRALGDALTTARLLLALTPRWQAERGIRSLAELAGESQDMLRASRREKRIEATVAV